MKSLRTLAAVLLCVSLTACQAPASKGIQYVRVSAHYTASGAVGSARAYVYAGKTVIEMDTAVVGPVATDYQGKPYNTSTEGRYVRFDGVEREVRLHAGRRTIDFTLAPVAKVFDARGVSLSPHPSSTSASALERSAN